MDELSGSQEVEDVGDDDGLNEKDRWISFMIQTELLSYSEIREEVGNT